MLDLRTLLWLLGVAIETSERLSQMFANIPFFYFFFLRTLSPGHEYSLVCEGKKKKKVVTSLFMWSWSRGRAVKVEKVKGEEAGVLQKHTPLPHAHIHMQTVGMQAEHMHACTHPRTNYRVNSCSLTSRCCQYDWGEEKRRSKESGEREERGGKDGGAAVYPFGRSARIVYRLLYTKRTLNHHIRGLWCLAWVQ